jgi:hypothetical protein
MPPLRLEVVAHTVQGLGLCSPCELMLSEAGVAPAAAERSLDEYPQDWQEEYRRLTDWVYELAERHGDAVSIKVIDPQSLGGFVKSVRYRIRRYPTWIVEGKVRAIGWDRPSLEAALQRP